MLTHVYPLHMCMGLCVCIVQRSLNFHIQILYIHIQFDKYVYNRIDSSIMGVRSSIFLNERLCEFFFV